MVPADWKGREGGVAEENLETTKFRSLLTEHRMKLPGSKQHHILSSSDAALEENPGGWP